MQARSLVFLKASPSNSPREPARQHGYRVVSLVCNRQLLEAEHVCKHLHHRKHKMHATATQKSITTIAHEIRGSTLWVQRLSKVGRRFRKGLRAGPAGRFGTLQEFPYQQLCANFSLTLRVHDFLPGGTSHPCSRRHLRTLSTKPNRRVRTEHQANLHAPSRKTRSLPRQSKTRHGDG